MSTIERIRERLAAHPELAYRSDESSLEVEAPTPDGFAVGITVEPNGYTVHFDGWHEHFDGEAEALSCFAFGLSGRCRLAVRIRGRSEVSFTLEHLEANEWSPESTTGLLIQPFWRRSRIEYRRNPRIELAAAQQAAAADLPFSR